MDCGALLCFSLMNYHLVRDPFDNILPLDLLRRIVTCLTGNELSKYVSKDTLEVLRAALHRTSNDKLEQALNWKSEQFVASPFYSFLPPFP